MKKLFMLFLFLSVFVPSYALAQDDSDFEDPFADPFADSSEDVTLAYKIPDPLEPVNRVIFAFNDKFFEYVFIPTAKGYAKVVPTCVRKGIANVFDNLDSPLTFFSACFQGEFKKAWITLERFTINTTLGIGGLFDPASYIWGIEEPSEEDLGLTLGNYGVGHGFYIVIPFMGPSSVRDLPADVAGGYLQPYGYVIDDFVEETALKFEDTLNNESFKPERYLQLRKGALDPYVAMRNFYVEYRNKKLDK